ncbi:hypothetical protein [Desulfocurvus sp. DL9XJH121]
MQERYAWVGILLVALIAGVTLYLVFTESERPRALLPRMTVGKANNAETEAEKLSAARAEARASAILAKRCVSCHGPLGTCRALGNKGKDAWDMILTRMMLAGSTLTTGEKLFLRDWLWTRPPGSSPPCVKRKTP